MRVPQLTHILSHCITSDVSGGENYELKGDYKSC